MNKLRFECGAKVGVDLELAYIFDSISYHLSSLLSEYPTTGVSIKPIHSGELCCYLCISVIALCSYLVQSGIYQIAYVARFPTKTLVTSVQRVQRTGFKLVVSYRRTLT